MFSVIGLVGVDTNFEALSYQENKISRFKVMRNSGKTAIWLYPFRSEFGNFCWLELVQRPQVYISVVNKLKVFFEPFSRYMTSKFVEIWSIFHF